MTRTQENGERHNYKHTRQNAYTTKTFDTDLKYGGTYWDEIARSIDERDQVTPKISIAGPP
jgi:hypothetical protein